MSRWTGVGQICMEGDLSANSSIVTNGDGGTYSSGVPILGSTKTFDELEDTFEVVSILHAHHFLSPRVGTPYSIGVEDALIPKDRPVGNALPSRVMGRTIPIVVFKCHH